MGLYFDWAEKKLPVTNKKCCLVPSSSIGKKARLAMAMEIRGRVELNSPALYIGLRFIFISGSFFWQNAGRKSQMPNICDMFSMGLALVIVMAYP